MVVVADLLTIVRFGIGLVLIPAAWSMELSYTTWLVSIAWLTDLADGRLARAGCGEGRMGQWDITADMVVSAGLLIGLAGSGEVPVIFAIGALVVFGGLALTGNPAAAMLLQLSGYLPLIWILWIERPSGWWAPVITAVVIGIVDWRRLVLVNIPNFIHGVASLIPGHSRRGW